jgi:hypothetical protein
MRYATRKGWFSIPSKRGNAFRDGPLPNLDTYSLSMCERVGSLECRRFTRCQASRSVIRKFERSRNLEGSHCVNQPFNTGLKRPNPYKSAPTLATSGKIGNRFGQIFRSIACRVFSTAFSWLGAVSPHRLNFSHKWLPGTSSARLSRVRGVKYKSDRTQPEGVML